MAWGSDTEWTISSFGEPWRIWLVPPFERHEQGPSRAAPVDGNDPLGALLYSGFDDAGAVSDEIAVPLLRIYDALTGRGVLQELSDPSRPTDDPRGLLRGFERELADTVHEAVELGRLRFERVVPAPWPFHDDDVEPDVRGAPSTVDEAPTTFVAVRLVDQLGNPVPRRGFAVVFADRTQREGFFDSEGALRIIGIPPGRCEITFPDLDVTDFAAPVVKPGTESVESTGPVRASEDGSDDSPDANVQEAATADTLSSMAERFGFLHFATIWSSPDNAALRDARESPHVLLTGDEVVIPRKSARRAFVPTGTETRFVVFREELHVKIRVRDLAGNDVLMDGASVRVDDEDVRPVVSGAVVDVELSARDAETLTLEIGDASWDLHIGEMSPIREFGGAEARLENLSFGVFVNDPVVQDASDPDALERKQLALELFQDGIGRTPSGDDSDGTLDDLRRHAGT